jgi:hypothetical protein
MSKLDRLTPKANPTTVAAVTQPSESESSEPESLEPQLLARPVALGTLLFAPSFGCCTGTLRFILEYRGRWRPSIYFYFRINMKAAMNKKAKTYWLSEGYARLLLRYS